MNNFRYISTSVAWALGWFALGCVVGYLVRVVREVEVVVEERRHAERRGGSVHHTRKGLGKYLSRFDSTRALGICVLVLALATATSGFYAARSTTHVNNELRIQSQCIQNYTNAFADALDARTKANTEAQAALDDLIFSINKPTGTPITRKTAFDIYVKARLKQRQTLADNPYPPAPRKVCDTP